MRITTVYELSKEKEINRYKCIKIKKTQLTKKNFQTLIKISLEKREVGGRRGRKFQNRYIDVIFI